MAANLCSDNFAADPLGSVPVRPVVGTAWGNVGQSALAGPGVAAIDRLAAAVLEKVGANN